MSTKAKLLAMTGNLDLPPAVPAPPPGEPRPAAEVPGGLPTTFPPMTPGAAKASTGPGQMLQFRGQLLGLESELGKMKERLLEYQGSLPQKHLDPASIVASKWSNRHEDSFRTPAFLAFKDEIAAAGGNVQAILVRPTNRPGVYEIVFGHRRHRACSELGLQVLTSIADSNFSDLELFSAMDRENRQREDLAPYEQGMAYRRALDEGLYPSMRRLAESLGVSHTWVRKVLIVAELPAPILACFRSPLQVQHRHAEQLTQAFEADRKGVLKRAEKLAQQPSRLAPGAVVNALVGSTRSGSEKAGSLKVNGKTAAKYSLDSRGRLSVKLEAWAIEGGKVDVGVLKALEQVLAGE